MRWKDHLIRMFTFTTYAQLKTIDLSQINAQSIRAMLRDHANCPGFFIDFTIGTTLYSATMYLGYENKKLQLEIEEHPEGRAFGNYGESVHHLPEAQKLYAEIMAYLKYSWKTYLKRIFKFATMIDCTKIDLDSFHERNIIPVITNTGFQLHFTCQSQRGFEPYYFGLHEFQGCLFFEAQDRNGKYGNQITHDLKEARQIYFEIIDYLTTP